MVASKLDLARDRIQGLQAAAAVDYAAGRARRHDRAVRRAERAERRTRRLARAARRLRARVAELEGGG
jgi:hypothetical protein